MTDHSNALIEGLYDGLAAHESQTKVAALFNEGLRDGIAEATRVPIMDKIASLVEDDAEIDATEEPTSGSVSEYVRMIISADAE